MNFWKISILCILFASSAAAQAEQGCAPGFYPGGTQPNGPICVPIPGYGTTNSTTSSSPTAPQSRWMLTWGAIAKDSRAGIMGYASGHFSKRAARRAAISECNSAGGGNCEVKLMYENQCAVIAEPADESIEFVTSIFQGGATIEEASHLATANCTKSNGGQACKIFYSNCTAPMLIAR